MFGANAGSQGAENTQDGYDDQHPIIIPQVKASEWDEFVAAMYDK